MHLKNRLVLFLVIISLGCSAIKLFTARFYHTDDGTTGIFLKKIPSFKSTFVDIDTYKYHVVIKDENTFIGENVYKLFADWLWWIPSLLLLLFSVRKSNYSATGPLAIKNKCLKIQIALGSINMLVGGALLYEAFGKNDRFYFNPLMVLPLPVLTCAYLVLLVFLKKKTTLITYLSFVLALILIVVIVFLYSKDLIIPYELWLNKGMPEKSI